MRSVFSAVLNRYCSRSDICTASIAGIVVLTSKLFTVSSIGMCLLFWVLRYLAFAAKKKTFVSRRRRLSEERRCQSPERSGAGTGAEASTARFCFLRRAELHKRD